MAEKQTVDGRYTLTTEVRAPFLNVITPKAVGKKGKASTDPSKLKYSGDFVIKADAGDLAAMKALAAKVAKARWPGRDLKELKFPFMAGEKKIEREKKTAEREGRPARKQDFYEGGVVAFSARSKYKPTLCRIVGGKVEDVTREEEQKKLFYNGGYYVPRLNFVAYEGQEETDDEGNKRGNPDGVNAYLDMVLFVKDGPKIGGASGVDVFKGFAGKVTDADPTAGDDEIPF